MLQEKEEQLLKKRMIELAGLCLSARYTDKYRLFVVK